MVMNRDKKVKKQRGSKTHGWGSMKKHRGAGNRGGRGNAGTGKRGDTIKPSLWKARIKLGKSGFKSKKKHYKNERITIRDIDSSIDRLIQKKIAKKEGDAYSLDFTKTKIGKLLANGTTSKILNITILSASKKAVEKVAAAKGKVVTKQNKGE